MWSEEGCAPPGTIIVGKAGDLLASFSFAGRTGPHCYPCLSIGQQARFQKDFSEQLEAVQTELSSLRDRGGQEWLPIDAALPSRPTAGSYRPRSDFYVFVSEAYPISKALIPAWSGQRGLMEFPAHRVVASEAGITHEIAHVLFPNGNRMLAEGVAVYLQNKLFPNIRVFPNFGDPMEALLLDFLRARYREDAWRALWRIDLEGLDQLSTPDKLRLRIGRDVIGAKPGVPDPPADEVKLIYVVAGSFVEFLLENVADDDLLTPNNFGSVYKSTPLRPLERDPGVSDRWQQFYRTEGASYSFTELGLLWKTYMHFMLFRSPALTPVAGREIPEEHASHPLVARLYTRLHDMAGLRTAPGRPSRQLNPSRTIRDSRGIERPAPSRSGVRIDSTRQTRPRHAKSVRTRQFRQAKQ